MRAKDFKIGWTVRAIRSTYTSEGLLQGEAGVVTEIGGYYVGVKHRRNSIMWAMSPEDLEVIKPRLPSVSADLRLTPQAKTVLAHLKNPKRHNRISPSEAERVYGISRLASCIHEIRKRAGYDVKTTVKRDDFGHKYARYSLVVH